MLEVVLNSSDSNLMKFWRSIPFSGVFSARYFELENICLGQFHYSLKIDVIYLNAFINVVYFDFDQLFFLLPNQRDSPL
jgi:hypothetical protein